MKAPNFVPYLFSNSISGVEAGLHGELAAQSLDECQKVAMYVAAEAPFRRFSVKRLNAFQCVAESIPQIRLAEGLERLDIGLTPCAIVKPDGSTFAVVDKNKRMRLTRNLSEEERQAVLNYDFAGMDESRRKRVAFYLDTYKLPAGTLDLPVLSHEEYQQMLAKCVNAHDGLALPMLRIGGGQLPIFDNGDRVTIVKGDRTHMNPQIYEADLGIGVLPPLSEAFTDGLNNGSIRNFAYRVSSVGDNALKISVTFTIDNEIVTHSVVRRTSVYDGGAFVVCSFGKFGALLFSNDSTLTVRPAEHTVEPTFNDNAWRVTRVRGGIRYVTVERENEPLGVTALPTPVSKGHLSSSTLAYDLGDTYFCGVMFHIPGNPIPIQFDAAKDVLPLIEAAPAVRDALCDMSWLPVRHCAIARSISQMFRDPDGALFTDPAPYMAARPYINQAGGYSVSHTVENGLYAGFKSRGMICNQADEEQAAAYVGSTAAILLLGLHQALQHTDNVKLRLSHPNNPAYKKFFMGHIARVLDLIHNSLTDADGNGFTFSSVEYIDEASCNIAGVYNMGVNGKLGAEFINNLCCDSGGSTTDISVCTFGNKRILLPALPIAGRVVTLTSLIQVIRGNGLKNAFRDISEGMSIVVNEQITPVMKKLLSQGLEPRNALEQMIYDPDLMEAAQTLLDYFTLKLNRGKSQLLQSLVCFKDLLVEDIILRQASRFYTEDDLDAGDLHLLRLGNGSRCVSLFCDEDSSYSNSHEVLQQILQERTAHHIGQKAKLSLVHNKKPKTEVSNGLACYDEQVDSSIEHWQDEATVQTPRELKERYLDAAIAQTMELAKWLVKVVPQICGDIHFHYSGLQNGFSQLLMGLEDKNTCRVALCDTIIHENGRFGFIHQMSASMGIDVWVAFAIMDHVNRNLAAVQAAQM